jgi:hypothetical protein
MNNNISNSLQLRNAIKSEYHAIKQESPTELFIVNKWNQFWQSVKDLLGVSISLIIGPHKSRQFGKIIVS